MTCTSCGKPIKWWQVAVSNRTGIWHFHCAAWGK